jgi:regulator of RNase E activity RraB
MFDFFKRKPSKEEFNLDMDQRVIEQLIVRGSNPEKEHVIEYAFAGDQNKLADLKAHLCDLMGFEEVREGGSGLMLVVSQRHKLDIKEINESTVRLRKIAEDYGVVFDGWGSLIEK